MRRTPLVLSVATLALAGCASTSPTNTMPTAANTAAATAAPIGPPAVGDGGRIAVGVRTGSGADIFTINADGTDRRQLTNDPAFDACPDFSARAELLAFCSNRGGVFEIWLMDTSGEKERRLTNLNGNSTFPDFSPDGRRVVFCGSPKGRSEDDHDIWVVNVDGTGLLQLTNTPGQDDCFPVWSPDGSTVLFASGRSGSPELWTITATGSGAKQLTTGRLAGEEPPDWSPDGKRIAFIADSDLWVMQADGTGEVRLTSDPATDYAPAWSPKGNEIVYRHIDSNDTGSLRIVTVQGRLSRELPLIENGIPLAPAWQPLAT